MELRVGSASVESRVVAGIRFCHVLRSALDLPFCDHASVHAPSALIISFHSFSLIFFLFGSPGVMCEGDLIGQDGSASALEQEAANPDIDGLGSLVKREVAPYIENSRFIRSLGCDHVSKKGI